MRPPSKKRVGGARAAVQARAMDDYERIARVLRTLARRPRRHLDLAASAELAGLSPFHFQRLFRRWAGVSPKDFQQCLSLGDARARLAAGTSALETALASGLSGPGRLHDLCVRLEAATPGELRSGGAGLALRAGFAHSPFGELLLAESARGVAHLAFVGDDGRDAAWSELAGAWPAARIERDEPGARDLARRIFEPRATAGLAAFVRGTRFQVQVWRALLAVPEGTLISYGGLARALGKPDAARAVGSAVGANTLAWLIPCHRVIRETGAVGDYRWGSERKQLMLAREAARSAPGFHAASDTARRPDLLAADAEGGRRARARP